MALHSRIDCWRRRASTGRTGSRLTEGSPWQLPGRHGEFLVACARNIQQAREEKAGRLTFQVGPTVYRGLWVVDGNFILEAARYLGYDSEAQQGLEATWQHQEAEGGVFAGGGREHVEGHRHRHVHAGAAGRTQPGLELFPLDAAQRGARREVSREPCATKPETDGSVNGRYGLLAPGFGDGGLGGIRSEFTNTVWVLAGLKAVTEATDRLGLARPGGRQAVLCRIALGVLCRRSPGDAPPSRRVRLPAHAGEGGSPVGGCRTSGTGPGRKRRNGRFPTRSIRAWCSTRTIRLCKATSG